MIIYQIIPILFLWVGAVIMTRDLLSPYNKKYCFFSHFTKIENKNISKLLISKKSPFNKGKEFVPEKNKLSVGGLVFYCLDLFALVFVAIMFIIPKNYITSYETETRYFFLYIDSVNVEAAFKTVLLLIPLTMIVYIVKALFLVISKENKI